MGDILEPGLLERIEPLASVASKEPGQARYTVACFEGSDWSLARLRRSGDEKKEPEFARKVSRALQSVGARLAYAPTPTKFNGELVRPDELLKEWIPLGDVTLYRNPGIPADGTRLPHRGCAGIFSAGGCSLIVATRRDEMIFAHAGRDCVLDRTRILTENRTTGRRHESVVHSILNELAPSRSLLKEVQEVHVAVYYSIRPEDFRHDLADKNPEHTAYNRSAMRLLPREYGGECGIVDAEGIGIDVPRIIRAQFKALGVPPANISLEHAYLSDELPTTRRGDGSGRYLVAVVRDS
jgi:hypothetical protein